MSAADDTGIRTAFHDCPDHSVMVVQEYDLAAPGLRIKTIEAQIVECGGPSPKRMRADRGQTLSGQIGNTADIRSVGAPEHKTAEPGQGGAVSADFHHGGDRPDKPFMFEICVQGGIHDQQICGTVLGGRLDRFERQRQQTDRAPQRFGQIGRGRFPHRAAHILPLINQHPEPDGRLFTRGCIGSPCGTQRRNTSSRQQAHRAIRRITPPFKYPTLSPPAILLSPNLTCTEHSVQIIFRIHRVTGKQTSSRKTNPPGITQIPGEYSSGTRLLLLGLLFFLSDRYVE